MPKFIDIYTLLVVALLLTGCSDKHKLSGTVVFPDGQPLTLGTVYFTNATLTARAALRSDGTYDVGTLSAKDGLPPGTYNVHISGAYLNPDDEMDFRLLIARDFASDATTPLEITIPGEKVYNITVERPRPDEARPPQRR